MLVDGARRDESFQRKIGYAQQNDLHLETSTVREALIFSARLRQPRHVSDEEKLHYVEEVIQLLGMESYADAVVGVPGEGKENTHANFKSILNLSVIRIEYRTKETINYWRGTRRQARAPPLP
jgi:hypothetical protein